MRPFLRDAHISLEALATRKSSQSPSCYVLHSKWNKMSYIHEHTHTHGTHTLRPCQVLDVSSCVLFMHPLSLSLSLFVCRQVAGPAGTMAILWQWPWALSHALNLSQRLAQSLIRYIYIYYCQFTAIPLNQTLGFTSLFHSKKLEQSCRKQSCAAS